MASNIIACRKVGCRITFNSYEQRKRHEASCSKSTVPPPIKFDPVEGGYLCKSCLIIVSHKNNLKRHERVCSNRTKPLHICNTCNKQFLFKSKLKRHKEHVHRNIQTNVEVAEHDYLDTDFENDWENDNEFDHENNMQINNDIQFESPDPDCVIIMLADGSMVTFGEEDVGNGETGRDGEMVDSDSDCDDYSNINNNDSGGNKNSDGCAEVLADDEVLECVNTLNESPVETSFTQNAGATEDGHEEEKSETRRKRTQRKKDVIKDVLNNVSSTEKSDILRSSFDKEDFQMVMHSDSILEAKLTAGILKHLKTLQVKKKHKELYLLLDTMCDDIDDNFLRYVAKKISVQNRSRFAMAYHKWKRSDFKETRGRKKLPLEQIQMITDTWYANSIPSVDCRNGRESISIRRSQYLQWFPKELKHEQPLLEKKKRNTTYYSSTRRVLTCTHQKVVEIIESKHGVSLPIGTVWAYKPFYAVYPSEKEKQLCLCTTCLNKRTLFNALRNKYQEIGSSLSGFLMGECDCTKDENGFWCLKCSTGACSDCKVKRQQRIDVPGLKEETSKIKFYQFEKTETPYKCKKTGNDKISKKVERTPDKFETPADVLTRLLDKSDEYLYHRYQEQNDKFVWKYILNTVDDPIFHMDYSENLGPTPKFEPQPSHFSKRQFTLHCTVMHKGNGNHKYVYHLSEDLSHDTVFTVAVIEDLISRFAPDAEVIRFKMDNCSSQYKCKYVFHELRQLAFRLKKTFIVYYGVKGHGKGLVDAMSGFGVKTPLRKGIVTHNFFSNSSLLLHEFLLGLEFKGDREYLHLDKFERQPKKEWDCLPIQNCRKQHMFTYFADGSIQYKENICLCDSCIAGNFVECRIVRGIEKFPTLGSDSCSDISSDCDDSVEEASDSDSSDDEVLNIIGDAVFEAIEVGSTIAVHSPPDKAGELFYLCQVHEKISCAKANFLDGNNKDRMISKGTAYLKCTYLEKVDEKKGRVFYKKVQGEAYVLPYQVFLPCVEISEDLTVGPAQYMDLICMF